MTDGFGTDSYNKVKRLSTEELEKLWYAFFDDIGNKKLRDQLIIQYLYTIKERVDLLLVKDIST